MNDLEDFRGKVHHGRVAIGPSFRDSDLSWRIAKPQIHVGHASTLLFADLICKDLEIPLWIRVNAGTLRLRSQCLEPGETPGMRSRMHVEHTFDILFQSIAELVEMLTWLEIPVEHFYKPREPQLQDGAGYEAILSVRSESAPAGFVGDPEWQWLDDAWIHWPSLLIRGGDWCAPTWSIGVQEFVRLEGLMFEASGHERYEANTPLITVDGKKMGAGDLNAVSWRILQPIGLEAARSFLVGEGELSGLPGPATEWDWRAWSKALQR